MARPETVRIVAVLRKLGIDVSATLVRNLLRAAGVPPARQRGQLDWRSFLQAQAAATLACDFLSQRPRLLIHDRDGNFSRAFDAIFHGEGIRVIRTPIQAPNANAHIERWVGSARRECLDRMLIFSHCQLERILRVYVGHYNEQRPHRALDLHAPDPCAMPSTRGDPVSAAVR